VQATFDCRMGFEQLKQRSITLFVGHIEDMAEVTNRLVTMNDQD